METHFGRRVRTLALNDRQYEIIIGSLLGDATLAKTSSGYCFRVHHGLAQRELVDWKYAELCEMVRTPPRCSGSGYYFRTVTHPAFLALAQHFYSNGRKMVPASIVARYLTPLAMAVWIMDDGAADGGQVRLNTQCFSESDVDTLRILIARRFGITVSINRDKGKPRLRFPACGMAALAEAVLPHLLPSMRYKLRGVLR